MCGVIVTDYFDLVFEVFTYNAKKNARNKINGWVEKDVKWEK